LQRLSCGGNIAAWCCCAWEKTAKLGGGIGRREQHRSKIRAGIFDATIIAAPSSTKNRDQARDPEMHQTRKGNQWYFGMKAHIGVDVNTGLVHTATATAANVADVAEVPNLLRGKETSVYGDAGYIGADKRVKPKRGRDWFIAAKRGKVKATEDDALRDLLEQIEHKKASVRARVEHPFRIVKRRFGYLKVRYRGLAKNGAQVMTLFALANLWMARRTVLAGTG
jgi:IS5 family transposase